MKSYFGRINKLHEAKNPRSLVRTLAQQAAPPRLPCPRINHNKMLGRRNIILLCITICMIPIKCADKYTDENRPYEFGFTIDGEQHRHEKKDENGIIMGEFGFITADGVYHVTVYATDENGHFKILSMKNIRVKPYPTAKSGLERGRSLEYSASPQLTSKPSVPEQHKKQFKEVSKTDPASPAKSCSHCKLPTTTTTTTVVPYIPSNKLPPVSPISQKPEIPPKLNQYKEKYSQNDVSAQGYIQQGQQQQQLQQEQQPQQLQQEQQQLQRRQQQLQQEQQQLQQGQQGQQQKQQQGPQQQQEQQLFQQEKQQQLQQEQQLLQQGQQQLQQGQQQVDQQPQEQQQQSLLPNGLQTLQQYEQGPREDQQQVRLEQQAQQQVNLQQQNIQQQALQEQKLYQFNKAQNNPKQETGSAQNYAQLKENNEGNYPQQSFAQEGFTKQQQQQTKLQLSQQYSNGSPQNYLQTGQNSNDNYPQSIYGQDGLGNNPSYQADTNQGKITSGGEAETNYPGSNIGQTHPQSVISENQDQKSQPDTNRNPKYYDNQSNHGFNALSSPANGFVSQESSLPKKPQLISAQMQLVDKSTDIHYKRPGEKEGLPEGLSKDDMSQLLYTFNYTVGFHGHFEEGYKNGAKVGYYYITGRNGVRTRVDYVANEKGFQPKITQEVLDLLSDDVPKPDTEKEPKYGLKGYEFKWLYYPVDTK